MNTDSSVTLRWPMAVLAAIALLVAGAGATYLSMASRFNQQAHQVGGPEEIPATERARQSGSSEISPEARPSVHADATVIVPADAMKRVGIETVPVTERVAASIVRVPGTIEPNAYKQVVVTPLVSGRVTRVFVELGDQVQSGQTLLQLFSPELADAQTKYLSAKAEVEAHEKELSRTSALAAIGAASTQEIERLHAEHSAKLAEVQSLRSRLVLLGMSMPAIDELSPGKDVEATTNVMAPMLGLITERAANAGLNVDPGTKLFTVVDLSTVWVVGALYERDLPRVRVGSAASVATTADPGLLRQGRVSYIDPQLNTDTRTARVRVEVPNPRQELRLGMYADVEIAVTNRQAAMIPRTAVQQVGDRQVVYVLNAGEPGTFTEREVRLGETSGEEVEVVSGVHRGDAVVSRGSFFIRAERERQGSGPIGETPNAPHHH